MRIVRGLAWLGLVLALAAAAGFYAGVLEEDRLLDALVRGSLAGVERSDTTAPVLAPAHAIHERTNRGVGAADLPLVERLESTSPFNMTAAVCLKHGVFGVIGHRPYGQCGPMTRILLNACWRLGIPARKLHLLPPTPSGPDIHTLAEWRSSGRWQVISPSDDFVWRTRDGRVATVEEIRADTTIFDQVRARYPDYPYRFDWPRHVRWEKLPAPLQAAARALLGERRYRELDTPRLYDRPRALPCGASLLTALAFLAAALAAGARWPSRSSTSRIGANA